MLTLDKKTQRILDSMVAKHGSKKLRELASLGQFFAPGSISISLKGKSSGVTIIENHLEYGIIGYDQAEAIGKVVFRDSFIGSSGHTYFLQPTLQKLVPSILDDGIIKRDFVEDYSRGFRFKDVAVNEYPCAVRLSLKPEFKAERSLSFSPDNKKVRLIPLVYEFRMEFEFPLPTKIEICDRGYTPRLIKVTHCQISLERSLEKSLELYAELLKPKYD